MLREYAAANDPFERRADYLQLGDPAQPRRAAGSALHFIRDFLDTV